LILYQIEYGKLRDGGEHGWKPNKKQLYYRNKEEACISPAVLFENLIGQSRWNEYRVLTTLNKEIRLMTSNSVKNTFKFNEEL